MTEGFDLSHFRQGTSGDDYMKGGSGNDSLNGNAGADTMVGGKGNDSYVVDNPGDKVVELPGQGTDTIYSFCSIHIPENVEKTFLIGTIWHNQDQNAYGNDQANYISGNCGANHIVGGGGNDTIFGGGYGRDILEGNAGNDWMQASRRDCSLYGGTGNDSLYSWFGNDLLAGGKGSDLYSGFTKSTEVQEHGNFIGFGHDVIQDDLDYNQLVTPDSGDRDVINMTAFKISELKFTAIDSDKDGHLDMLRIDAGKYGMVDIKDYFNDSSSSLAGSKAGYGYIEDIQLANHQHLTLSDIQNIAKVGGQYDAAVIKGNSSNNSLHAAGHDSMLYGGAGNDTLYSGDFNDTLCGGAGNDTYTGFNKDYDDQNLGWGHDTIRDYLNSDGSTVNGGGSDKIDLTNFGLHDLTFKAYDTDHNGNYDTLHIDAGKYGFIDIDKYFDNSANSVSASHAGIGNIEDIALANGVHLHFGDVQGMLS